MNNPDNFNIDVSAMEDIKCEVSDCGSKTFVPVFVIKKISALMSPTGQETLAPLQIFQCSVCGHINELFLDGLTN